MRGTRIADTNTDPVVPAPNPPRTGSNHGAVRRRRLAVVAAAVVLAVAVYVVPARWERARALSLAARGDFAVAELGLKTAAERDPTDLEVVKALARGYLSAGDDVRASPFLARWTELRPRQSEPARLRFQNALQLGQTEEALAAGRHLLDLDPADRVARGQVGLVCLSLGKLDEAEYAQRAQLFVGDGAGRFRDVSTEAGAYFRRSLVGRGLAVADFDDDGRPDLAFSNNGGPAVLLRNATPTANRWLSLELEGDGVKSNRNAIGARVEVEAGGRRTVRHVVGGGSYLSASDRRLLIGLGTAKVEGVTVRWPSGRVQRFGPLEAGGCYRLREGQEKPSARR